MDVTSIVIVTQDQLEYTRLCLASIFASTPEPYELIVVDNGSSDGTPDYLKGIGNCKEGTNRPVRTTIAMNPENRGFPAAANQGIGAATGQQIVLLNNDTIVTSGWLTRMLLALHSDPRIGMVGACSNFVSGPQ